MSRNSHHVYLTAVAIAAVALVASPARGVHFVWSGGGSDDNWSNYLNWTPSEFGPPGNVDSAEIGNGDAVLIDGPFAGFPNLLTVANGSSLLTNGYEAVFDDGGLALTLITAGNSALVVQPNNSGASLDSFDTDLLTVADGGFVFMEGGVLEVDSGKLDIHDGGGVIGYGSIDLEASSGGVVLENDGILWAIATHPVSGTLDIDVSSANGRIDLDGNSGNGQVFIGQLSTLDIGAPLNDPHSDLIGFAANSKLIMSDPWSADANSTIEVDAASTSVPDVATIAGAAFTSTGAINVNSGTLVIESTFNASGATVNVAGQGQDATLQLDGTATLTNLDLMNNGGGTASLRVNGNTTITQPTLDWDANGLNTTAVGPTGVLTLNVAEVDLGNNVYNATIYNRGEINVNLTNPLDEWTMAGVLNMNGSTGARLNAGNMNVTGSINVDVDGFATIGGGGTLTNSTGTINVNSGTLTIVPTFNASGAVIVGGGSETTQLRLLGTTTLTNLVLDGAGGLGTADLIVHGNTTITQATLDWDASTLNTTYIGAGGVLTLNVGEVDLGNNTYDSTINTSGEININLTNPLDTWTMAGYIFATDNATFSGSGMTNSGYIDIRGGTLTFNSEIDSTLGTISVGFMDGGTLQLNNTARISDLVIWPSLLASTNLIVNGNTTITQAEFLWDTGNSTTTVGATGVLTLDIGRIFGDTYSDTINLSGELNVNLTNPADTWTMAGVLNMNASTGATFNPGNVIITGEVNVFAFPPGIPALPASGAKGAGGVTTAGVPGIATIAGNEVNFTDLSFVNVAEDAELIVSGTNGAIDSPIAVGAHGLAKLAFTEGVTMTGDLSLLGNSGDPDPAVFDVDGSLNFADATISGSGYVKIELLVTVGPGTIVTPATLIDSATTVNGNNQQGPVLSGGAPGGSTGMITFDGDYEQTVGSIYEAEIGGLTLADEYDNITVTGTATLDGELNITLIDGFVPSPGDTFEVFTYGDHVGEFAAITGDVVFTPSDYFYPVYQANRLLLYVPLPGDGNLDGTVDGLDYLLWAAHFGDNPAADPPGFPFNGDFNFDNIVNGLDYLVWAAHFGETSSGFAVAVPEPGSFLLLTIATIALLPPRRAMRMHV